MSGDCVSLISHPVTLDQMIDWVQVDDLDFVLHTEKLTGVCVTGDDYITADPFIVPDLDVRLVAALVLHPCDSPKGLVKRFQYPAYGLKQCDKNAQVTLCNWCDEPESADCDKPACDPCEDPCARYERLYCKLEEMICGDNKASLSARDRSIAFSRPDVQRLEDMVHNAKIECERARGVCTSPRRFRVELGGRYCDY